MNFRRALCFLLFLIIGVLPCFSQIRGRSRARLSINGYVRDNGDLHGLENIRVDLKQASGIPITTSFTRANGEFEFSGLRNGDYIIEIDADGYEPFQMSVSILNAPLEGLSLYLVKPATGAKKGDGAIISAHQLSAPRKAQDAFGKGMNLLYAKSDYQGAIEQFQRAIKYFPTYYEAYAAEASAYLSTGQSAPAEEALRKSVDLSSQKYPEALLMLSSLLTDAKRFPEALPFARKAMEDDPTSWRGPFELARAQFGLNQIDEAEKSALQSRDLDPKKASVYLILANIHIRRKDSPALLKDLNSYLNLNPTGPTVESVRNLRDRLLASQQAAGQNRADEKASSPQTSEGDAASPAPEKQPPPPSGPDSSEPPSPASPAPSNPQ